jgi:hypothetical protein
MVEILVSVGECGFAKYCEKVFDFFERNIYIKCSGFDDFKQPNTSCAYRVDFYDLNLDHIEF